MGAARKQETKAPQWTPGPWRVSAKYPADVVGPDGYEVADFASVHLHEDFDGENGRWGTTPGSHREMPESEEKANAQLAAAAPELYEALRDAFAALARPGGPEFGPRGRDRGLPDRMRLAIAKAEGR